MRLEVNSSHIRAADYNLGDQSMVLEFKGGRTYKYQNVSPQVYATFMEAPSKGQYLAKVIKPVCPCEEILPPPPELIEGVETLTDET